MQASRAVLSLSLSMLAVACSGSSSEPKATGPSGLIAYSNRTGPNATALWVMSPDGSGRRQLAGANSFFLGWTPQGDRVAYGKGCSDSPGAELRAVRADGTQDRKLADGVTCGFGGVAWSPDGRRVAYTAFIGLDEELSPKTEIRVVGAEGTAVRRLTTGPHDERPAWSPDGRRIAFIHEGDLNVMNGDGSDVRRLTDSCAAGPRWSADGKRIFFTSNRPDCAEGPTGLYVMRADGSGVVAVADHVGAWSLGRNRLVYESRPENATPDVKMARLDGSAARVLGATPEHEIQPSLSPDGGWVAFTRGRFDEACQVEQGGQCPSDVWIIRADGAGARRLTETVTAADPAWSPA